MPDPTETRSPVTTGQMQTVANGFDHLPVLNYFVTSLLCITWALWFGGLIALFLIVTQLLKIFNTRRDIFGEAGSGTFMMFERFQLIVGALALLAAFALRLMRPVLLRTLFFLLLFVAATGAVASPLLITPKIEALRHAGDTNTPQFKKLHGVSMMVYSADALVLLGAGILLPAVIGRRDS